jgi:N-methylhydantoinase B
MPLSVEACVERLDLGPGDVAVLNDPYRGGTHLPDITMVAPVFPGEDGGGADAGDERGERLLGYVAARAHHADVGGSAPGSLPLARELYEEGLVIPPVRLVEAGRVREDVREIILANVRTPEERAGDLRAQRAAVERGAARLSALAGRYGRDTVHRCMGALLTHAERTVRSLVSELPDGSYRFRDVMEDDGRGGGPATVAVEVRVEGDGLTVDFEGTDPQRESGINAVLAITLSAVHYVVRALVEGDVPSNAGCMAPVTVRAPRGSLVNARPPAAVAGGNVETSQRIVDVLLGALAQACPDRVPAASQGTMNNVTVGGRDPKDDRGFAYYETLAGGTGARPGGDGADAHHSHMTNTLNTPVEALEYAYPLRVRRYALRTGSGGEGRWRGGEGLVREMEFRVPARVTLLSERRRTRPYGLEGGGPGSPGRNVLIRGDDARDLPGKGTVEVEAGDVLRVETPGGGGWGAEGA